MQVGFGDHRQPEIGNDDPDQQNIENESQRDPKEAAQCALPRAGEAATESGDQETDPPRNKPPPDTGQQQYRDLEISHSENVELRQHLREPDIEVAVTQLVPHVGNPLYGRVGYPPDQRPIGLLNAL